ncbi:MAG: peptidase C26 [Halobacteriovorax sp.]|nr:peptidase C26 [Halobacteriovorax sp.]|tara:strand:- start:72487 stop:73236 length:750 start_codon:yes stop_codon:yes gene_type:complete
MIKIAMTPCFFYKDPSRTVFGHKELTYMENDMVRYLARPGVMPYLLPDLKDDLLLQYLEEADGFIIQGGSDLCPETYGDDYIDKERWPGDPYRDQYELKVIDYAFKNKKPIYGICRGFQVLNAYFGGSLHQDINTEIKTKQVHRDPDKYDHINHEVDVTEDGLLHKIYEGKKKLQVNSVHHQAVKRLGDNLKVDALSSSDQIIEAFHYDGDQCAFGVQWHPEFSPTLKDVVCDPTPLYDYFLSEVEKNK